MTKNKSIHLNKWLLPFSWLYGFAVHIRNKLFDWHILKQQEYDIPIICVGNITVGGTGKTPQIEYLIRLLQDQYRVAVLSRGYNRHTKGFLLATSQSNSLEIGDEPFQIKQKFPNIDVAVDGDRRQGIAHLLQLNTPPQVILLDDAFQHRYVKASFILVLSDYNRPVYADRLLPAGRLREPAYHRSRANIIVVTKCPLVLKPIDYRIVSHHMNLYPYQSLFFTTLVYGKIKSVFDEAADELELNYLTNKNILLVTGIASPTMLLAKVKEYATQVELMTYPDHHNFSPSDIATIKEKFENTPGVDKLILLTEKDATRLVLHTNISEEMKRSIYYIPIEIAFTSASDKRAFDSKIKKHVKEYTRNSLLSKS